MAAERAAEDSFEPERYVYHLVTQETRYLILQFILAHPENLPTLDELDYVIPKSKSTIREHLDILAAEGIINDYQLEQRPSRDLPRAFFGLTESGIDTLHELGFLRGKPILQTLYTELEKPEKIQRYEAAPRPPAKSASDVQDELERLTTQLQGSMPEGADHDTLYTRLRGLAGLSESQPAER